MTTPHPAPYSKGFEDIFAEKLKDMPNVLDIFGGIGRLALIKDKGYTGVVVISEIERPWAMQAMEKADLVYCGDSAHLPFADNTFYAGCTSPTYASRMADHHDAKDASKRITYTHVLGHKLADGNTGAMGWGSRPQRRAYCAKHKECYMEWRRVLKDGALVIVNVSDHLRTCHFRKGHANRTHRMKVVLWHRLCLQSLGFVEVEHLHVATPRMRRGRNGEKRVSSESIIVFELRKEG